MVTNVSPKPPEEKGETPDSIPIKPNQPPPRDDRFRKTYREARPYKNEKSRPKNDEDRNIDDRNIEDRNIEESDDDFKTPSLFDLSKKAPTKGKTSPKYPFSKDQFSSDKPSTDRPLSSKYDHQEGNLVSQNEGELVESDSFQEPLDEPILDEPLFATAEEAPTTDKELAPDMPKPQDQNPESIKKSLQQAGIKEELNRQEASNMQELLKSKKSGMSSESKESEKISKKESKKESGSKVDVGQDKGEIAAVHSRIQSVNLQAEKTPENQDVSRSATIKELASQIIEGIQVMRKDDLTSTMITLKHPPVLEGATITLTTSDNAKREFSISFANLSPDAKAFLDIKLKEDSLVETLEKKGIIVNTLTTSTQPENLINIASGQTSGDRQERQQQQQEQQQQKKQQEFQEEEES